MHVSSLVRGCLAAAALIAILDAHPVARADEPPTGELWHQTMSIAMQGMNMPPNTMKLCLPRGKAQEALSKPQGPGMNSSHCTVEDARREGNKFTAKFMCAGAQPVQGTLETIFEGGHATGTMTLSMSGQQMTIKTESTKVGTACAARALPGIQ